MRKILLVAWLVLFALEAASGAQVKLAIDMIRHGARAPSYNYSFFPNITWPLSEELTPVGERQQCLLGHLRRLQYVENSGLLPQRYDPTSIYVRSTDVRRTLMSAQAYLIGLYPTGLTPLNQNQMRHVYDLLKPPIDLEISDDIIDELKENAMPFGLPIIPIQSVNYSSEALLLSADCPFVDYMIVKYFDSQKYRDLIENTYKNTWLEIIAAYPEITMNYLLTKNRAYLLADFIICAAKDGRKPYKIPDSTVGNLRRFVGDAQVGIFTMDPLMNKIGLEMFTDEVLTFMNRSVSGSGKLKYVLYSAHDISQVVLLLGLQKMNQSITIKEAPDFAANVLFELTAGDDKQHYVTIYYNGNVIYSATFENFAEQFKKLGEIGKPREEACKVVTGLRVEWKSKNRAGIIEDFRFDENNAA